MWHFRGGDVRLADRDCLADLSRSADRTSPRIMPHPAWTSLASDMKTIESLHTKCQRRILGISWHVRNSEVSLRTGLAPVSDRITRSRNAIFGHVARLPDNIPAHQIKSSYRSVDTQTLHGNVHQVDHVPNGLTNSAAITTVFPLRLCGGKLWSRSLDSDATVRADYALTTTTARSIASGGSRIIARGGAAAGTFGVPQSPSCPLSLRPLRKFRGS